MSNYKPFDPLKCSVIVGTHKARAFSDDQMVMAEFTSDWGDIFMSTDGEGRHVESADRSGTVTISLATNSPSNAVFMALIALNEPVPITITDKSSNADLFFAGSCKIKTFPPMDKKKGNAVNEYVWKFPKGTIFHSGAEL